jgi:hypothetical protein
MIFNSYKQFVVYVTYSDGSNMALDGSVPVVFTSRSPDLVSVISASGTGLLASKIQTGSCYVVASISSLGLSDSTAVSVFKSITVNNPSFETPASASDWTFAPSCGSNCGSSIQPNGGAYGQANAPDGSHVAALQGSGSISQQVTFDEGAYKIQFMAAKRPYGGLQTIKVYFDDVEIGSFTPNTADFVNYVTTGITVTSGVHTLKFAGTNTVGDNTGFIDIVSIVDSSATITKDEPMVNAQENMALITSPNPFNPSVNIQVGGCKSGAELKILNIDGKIVADLTATLNGGSHAGRRQVVWNASGYASGVYLVMFRNGNVELKRKIMLIR